MTVIQSRQGDMDIEERTCPACGDARISGPLSEEGGFSLVACRTCGMLFTRNVRSMAAKIRHYEQMSKMRMDSTAALSPAHYGLANQIRSIPLYDAAIRFIRSSYPQGEVRVVDAGCAGGLFLLAVQIAENSYNCGTSSRFSVRGIAIDPLEKKDTERNVACPVLSPEAAASQWGDWAHVVTAFNVLEHVNQPFEFITSLRSVLKPGGILIVDVPNNYVLELRSRLMRRWPGLDLGEHINHFVPKTLDLLLARAGCRPLRRLPGLLGGTNAFAQSLRPSVYVRWALARALMAATCGRIQAFPHMTMAYRRMD